MIHHGDTENTEMFTEKSTEKRMGSRFHSLSSVVSSVFSLRVLRFSVLSFSLN